VDPEGDQVTLDWDFKQNGLFADAQGPNPVFSAAGLDGPQIFTVSLRCTDSGGLTSIKSTTITVRNVGPSINSMPPTQAVEGQLYKYEPVLADPGPHDVLTCKLAGAPMGMALDPKTCAITWTPTYDQARGNGATLTLTVTDSPFQGVMPLSTTQTWTVGVKFIDSDMDGLPDTWEKLYFGNLAQGPGDDPDKDGRPNLKEYIDGTDPTKNDGPSGPTIISPDNGAWAPTKPSLTIANATSPRNEAVTYTFEIYSDAQLMNLVDVNVNVMQGQNGKTVYVPPKLAEDKHYWWRARARDPFASGPWSTVATFFANDTHEPPTTPMILAPLNQSKVKAVRPLLQVQNSKSADELPLVYTFEIYDQDPKVQPMAKPIDSSGYVLEGAGGMKNVTAYKVNDSAQGMMKPLQQNQHYWWRVKATDQGAPDGMSVDSAWSDVVSFHLVLVNDPPELPNITFPKEGDRVSTKTPEIRYGGAADPDGESIAYYCELDSAADFSSPAKQSVGPVLPNMANDQAWTPNALDENGRYCVRCRAQDPSGTSGWAESCFLVDTQNDPPTVPKLQNPADGGTAAGDVVRFTWVNSTDPEGDSIRYEIEVFADEALTMRVAKADGDDGPTGSTIVGISPGTRWWRARALDIFGAASEWSAPNKFEDGPVDINVPFPEAEGCNCRVSATRTDRGAGAGVLAMLGLVGLLVVRRRRR
jgi:MYXO-CTERM domain-containing protein